MYYPSWNQYGRQDGLIRVTGADGAKAYQMAPNSSAALFDGTRDAFYVKTTDGAGFATIRTFEFSEVMETPANPESNIMQEVQSIREELEYVKQSIRGWNPEGNHESSESSDAESKQSGGNHRNGKR